MSFLTWAAIKLFFGKAMTKLWDVLRAFGGFLKRHSIWLTVSLVLALCWGADHIITHRALSKTEGQLAKCAHDKKADEDTLAALRAQSKVQQRQSGKVIDHYITVEKPVIRTEVQRIESAPLPGNCGTPKEVLGADV